MRSSNSRDRFMNFFNTLKKIYEKTLFKTEPFQRTFKLRVTFNFRNRNFKKNYRMLNINFFFNN